MATKHRPGLIVIKDKTSIEPDLVKITRKKAEVIAIKIIQKLNNKSKAIKH